MSPVIAPEEITPPRTRAEAYTVLGVPPGASFDQVKKAYRSRAWTAHPDQDGTPGEWLRVSAAWELLRNISPEQAAADRAQEEAAPDSQPENGDGFDPSFAGTNADRTTPEPSSPPPPQAEAPAEETTPPVTPPGARKGQWRPGRLLTLRPDPWLVCFAVVLVVGTIAVGTVAGATATPALAVYAAGWALILLWRAYGRPWGR